MRNILIILFIFIIQNINAQDIIYHPNHTDENGRQGKWTTLFDDQFYEVSDSSSASYFRIITYKDDVPQGIVRDYFINGDLYWTGKLIEDRPFDQMDGICKWYGESGSLESIEFHRGDRTLQESIEELQSDPDADHIEGITALAHLYHDLRMPEARALYQKLVSRRKEVHGLQSFQYANALSSLAWDYLRHEDYVQAEPLFFEAKTIIDEIKEDDMYQYAMVLNDLGDYYSHVNRCDDALEYFQKAIEVLDLHVQLNKNDNLSSVIMHNSASCYRAKGEFEEAIKLSDQVVQFARNRYGKYHRETAYSLWGLSEAYQGLGEMEKASTVFEEVTEIYFKLYGPSHPEYLRVIYTLGYYHMRNNDFNEGAKAYLSAYEGHKELYGDIHPQTIRIRRNYAFALYRQGIKAEAINILRKAAEDRLTYLHRYFDNMNEESRLSYYRSLQGFEWFQSSLMIEEGEQYPELKTDLLNMHLRNKAILISTSNAIKKRILESNDRKLIQLYNEVQDLKQQLEDYRSAADNEIERRHAVRKDSLFELLEIKDRELNRLSSIYSVNNAPLHWHQIRNKLAKNEALVEIRSYQEFDLEKWGWSNQVRYMAFVITPKTKEQPEIIVFNKGNELENSSIKYYANAVKYQQEDTRSYRDFWKPLEKALKKYDHIYFSSDGVFHKVNLQTLFNPNTKKYLFEEKNIQLITSGRDLLEEPRKTSSVKFGMLLGNPSFGEVPEGVSGTFKGIELFSDGNERGGISPLPGAEEEVATIGKLLDDSGWKSLVLTNKEAEEMALRDMLKPNILHIATHGFFDQSSNEGNPLHNTGLLFTGAANHLSNQQMSSSNDGILTSFEALNLNIDNTNLVVLSA
ncbi:MAG: CHAT domain-containing tetratricopeptide repeat protein, partial [Bacteroidota bacterium]